MEFKGRLEKRRHWAELIEQWGNSGQSKASFCRDHDLSECQFHYWHGRSKQVESLSGSGFSRVDCVPDSGLRLRLGAGFEFELDSDFDELTLKRFLSVLRSLC